jgi:hypothetical protein
MDEQDAEHWFVISAFVNQQVVSLLIALVSV